MKFANITILIIVLAPFWCTTSYAETSKDCITCHKNPIEVTAKNGTKRIIQTNENDLKISVHQNQKCAVCHTKKGDFAHPDDLSLVPCQSCHPKEKNLFLQSPHGKAQSNNDPDAPRCITCHNNHKILSSKEANSLTNPVKVKVLCFKCHTNPQIIQKHNLPSAELIKAYQQSVHALPASSGIPRALCTDCHGAHEAKALDYVKNPASKLLIPAICGSCHEKIQNEYARSIHGKAIANKILDAPVCTDCHGEHSIAEVKSAYSKVSIKELPKTCASCHEKEKLSEKYGIPANRYTTYENSYHGIINKYRAVYSANCASCHGYHNILPSSDPLSTINKANLPKTCGKCHPGANKNFAVGSVHIRAVKEDSFGVYVVRKFYTWFIIILMVLFTSHILLDILKIRRSKKKE